MNNHRLLIRIKTVFLVVGITLTGCFIEQVPSTPQEQATEILPKQQSVTPNLSSETRSAHDNNTKTNPDAEGILLNSIFSTVAPSVVHIKVSKQMSQLTHPFEIPLPDAPDEFFRQGEGSGFVLDKYGHIVTNYHVVQNSERLEVTFFDGITARAEVISGDPDSDLAVIKVTVNSSMLKPVILGDSDQVFIGQRAVAIGNPFGQTWTLTTGIVSAIGRTLRSGNSPFSIPEMIQTDAAINPGNSGGPLLDTEGKVVGVNTMILSQSRSSAGVGFAVPVNIVKQIVPSLIEMGHYSYPWLGISGSNLSLDIIEAMELNPLQRGALVMEVIDDSPAARAGLRGSKEIAEVSGQEFATGGDIIVAIENTSVQRMDDLIAYLVKRTRPEDKITLTVLRDNEEILLPVTLSPRPES